MGVRISVYAVDIIQLEILACQSLHDVLWFYADQHCISDSMPTLHLYVNSSKESGQFLSKPGRGLTYWENGVRTAILKRKTTQDQFLSSTVEKCYTSKSSYVLKNLLDCFSACPEIEWVHEVTAGHRRWWVGSFLVQAEQILGVSSQNYSLMTRLLQKMLRGYDCGKSLLKRKYQLEDIVFPILPNDDTDLWMSVWSEDEVHVFLETLDLLVSANPQFKAPPEKVGIAPQNDADWNSWVYEMLQKFKQIAELQFENLNIVSFIDS